MEVVPNPRDEKEIDWCKASVVSLIPKDLKEEGAIVESLVRIWRLSHVKDKGVKDSDWKAHVKAWEVRVVWWILLEIDNRPIASLFPVMQASQDSRTGSRN